MLCNFALDRSTDTLNDTWIDEALTASDDEINATCPVALCCRCRPCRICSKRQAIVIAFYWLGDRDPQVTNLLQDRYDRAIAKEIAAGKIDLGLPT